MVPNGPWKTLVTHSVPAYPGAGGFAG